MKNNQYYVHLNKGEFYPIKAQSVVIPEFEEFDFFIHRPTVNIDGEIQISETDWVITEGKTGMIIVFYSKHTRKQLIKRAQERLLKNFNKITFQDTIETNIEMYGLSPRYGGSTEGIKQISIFDYIQEFKNIFRVPLDNYLDIFKTFDIIKFDEQFIKPKEGQSTKEKIFEVYGQIGVDLVEKLLDIHIEI